MSDPKAISDSALHFIKSHSLMDDTVGALGGKPFFFRKNLILTKLAVDSLDSQDKNSFVVFAGSGTKKIAYSAMSAGG